MATRRAEVRAPRGWRLAGAGRAVFSRCLRENFTSLWKGLILVSCFLSLAVAGVDTPSVGFAQSNDGTVLKVSGIAGAFVTTATEHTAAISSGFSARLGFAKFALTLRVLNGAGETISESDAPEGDALFGFSPNGDTGVAYYLSTQTMAVFIAGGWRSVPFPSDAPVLAVRMADSDHVAAVIARDALSLISIRIADGAIEDETAIGPGRAPVLLPNMGGVLFRRDDALIYRDPTGNEKTVDIPSVPESLLHMSVGWAQVLPDSGPNLAVRLTPGIRVYQIPEVSQ